MAGFCWRYNNMIQETFEAGGGRGDRQTRRLLRHLLYKPGEADAAGQRASRRHERCGMADSKNWYNFVWLCGDSIVEQAVHSVDKIAWAMHDQPPVSCVGVGGRAIPAEGGNIYDHFEVNYLYPNGMRAFLANRQIEGCYNENSDYMLGTDGTCTIGRGPTPRIEGKTNWTWTGQKYDMYQREHDLLFASIRQRISR